MGLLSLLFGIGVMIVFLLFIEICESRIAKAKTFLRLGVIIVTGLSVLIPSLAIILTTILIKLSGESS